MTSPRVPFCACASRRANHDENLRSANFGSGRSRAMPSTRSANSFDGGRLPRRFVIGAMACPMRLRRATSPKARARSGRPCFS